MVVRTRAKVQSRRVMVVRTRARVWTRQVMVVRTRARAAAIPTRAPVTTRIRASPNRLLQSPSARNARYRATGLTPRQT